tara:strand:+ start:412 stop:966 length:555 start_codon:yes stop_codon:yes gene_type:complete
MKWIDWVGHYKNILSVELCNQIIDYKFDYVKSTYATHKGLSPNEKRVEMDEIWIRKDHTFYKDLNDAVTKVAKKYTVKMKSFHDRDFVVQKTTDFRLNKYDVGGYMSRHCDNIHHSHGQTFGYPQASVLLFLNDNFKGGEFLVSEEQPKIKTGEALIFPSNFMFPHEVKKITQGTRWSIVSWLM